LGGDVDWLLEADVLGEKRKLIEWVLNRCIRPRERWGDLPEKRIVEIFSTSAAQGIAPQQWRIDMRELSMNEASSVGGGWDNTDNPISPMIDEAAEKWSDFVSAVRSWWDRWPCGSGSSTTRSGQPCSQLTDKDINAALYSIGGIDALTGKNGTPLNSSQIQELGKKGVENVKKWSTVGYPQDDDSINP
jgi:hypothetical protein